MTRNDNFERLKKPFAVLVAAFGASLLGGFSHSQSVVLALLAAVLSCRGERQGEVSYFRPFEVHITPRWKELLTDYKVLDVEKWEAVRKNIDETRPHILINGISFAVLTHNPKVRPGLAFDCLVYLETWRRFYQNVYFRLSIEEIDRFFDFYVKWGETGYELGITTPESRERIVLVGDERDIVKVAEIPYEIFYPWYGLHLNTEAYTQLLKEKGWERKPWMEDAVFYVPKLIEHKYFLVSYGDMKIK